MKFPVKPGMTGRQECKTGRQDRKARMQAGQKGKSLFQIHKVQDFIPDVLFADFIEDFVAHAWI